MGALVVVGAEEIIGALVVGMLAMLLLLLVTGAGAGAEDETATKELLIVVKTLSIDEATRLDKTSGILTRELRLNVGSVLLAEDTAEEEEAEEDIGTDTMKVE